MQTLIIWLNFLGEISKARLRSSRPPARGDSESDDTSGSPCGDCPSGPSYRVPVKPSRGNLYT